MRRVVLALPYAMAALLILWPLLAPGYVLTLDMVVAPPTPDWLQKLGLFLLLCLMGVGAHRLFNALWQPKRLLAAYFAGLFYMFNPFVYSRFMAGQYKVLLGYALLPFFVRAWVLFVRQPDWRGAVWASVWLVGISFASIHAFGFALLAAVAFAAAYLWQRRQDAAWRRKTLKHTALAAGLTLLGIAYWLVPALIGHGKTAATIAGFGNADLAAFATTPNGFGWLGNVLALQGFWADAKSLYLVPSDVFSWWWLPWVGVWVLVAFGVYKSWQKQKAVTAPFVALVIVAALLAIGTAGTVVAPLNEWLVTHVPFFAGYREPQKFVAIIALAYAYFCAVAVDELVHKIKLAALPLFALPLLIAPLLPGFYGQLTPHQYPADWSEVNTYLKTTDPQAKALFLPWHLYMRFNFAERIIANPAPLFFANPVVISNDPELAGATSGASTNDERLVQTKVVPALKYGGQNVAQTLRMLNIRYVIMAKELDYRLYARIELEDGIKLVRETENLKLYEITTSR